MTDRPIIFSAPMVQALLAGRKTMTRRLALTSRRLMEESRPGSYRSRTKILASTWQKAQPGDRIWVRENHQFRGADYGDSGGETEWFRAYGSGGAGDNWDPEFPDAWEPSSHARVRKLVEPDEQEGDNVCGYVTKLLPSIHMPRWASRLTLIVTAVKVERLWDISDDDIRAEGITDTSTSWLNAWRELWESINGPDDWNRNPEVVALSFRIIKANIDTVSPPSTHTGRLAQSA